MIIECAWCGSILGEKDGLGSEGTTSGICGKCSEAIAKDKDGDDDAVLARGAGADERAVPSGRSRPRRAASWARRSAGGRG